MQTEDDVAWLPAAKDYQVGLKGGKLVCKNPKGKTLASVPKWLKEEAVADQLIALSQWLSEHQLECQHTIERWMLRSLTIPRAIAAEVWPDPDWKRSLENIVVAPADARGKVDYAKAGLLKDADAKRGLGILDLDGESRWLKQASFVVPHPILVPDLEEIRELASDLQISQQIEQLYRPIHSVKKDQLSLKSIRDYEAGEFEQLNFATSLCRRLGYPVRGGYATCRIWEGGNPVEARYFIGDENPELATWTGELLFVDEQQNPLRMSEVGQVTFSEGICMAEAIYAKRKLEETTESA